MLSVHFAGPSAFGNDKREFCRRFNRRQQRISGLPAKRREILHRTRVGRDDFQHMAGFHFRKRFLGAQDGQGAIQALDVEFFADLSGIHEGGQYEF